MNSRIEVNPNKYVYFTILPQFVNRASSGFSLSYFDSEKGKHVQALDPRGAVVRYKFNKSKRMLRIHKGQEDVIDLIRNHPECEGSPNGQYREINGKLVHLDATFKEMNSDKDADVVISAAKLRAEALQLSVELMNEPEKAEMVATILNINTTGKSSFAGLMTYAEGNPKEFLSVAKADDIEYRGLIKKAINTGVLERRGVTYFIGTIEFGIEEDDMLKSILTDKDKYTLLYRKVYGVDPLIESETKVIEDTEAEDSTETEDEAEQKPKRGRGRPSKS